MTYRGEHQGWHVVEWALDIEPGVSYLVEVQPDGEARALFVTRLDRLPISASMSVSDAFLVCARHSERHEIQSVIPGGWRPSSWALRVERAPRRDAQYLIDVDPDGAARAAYSSLDEHISLGILPDLGHAIWACAKAENARVFAPKQAAV